jgi:hypothetical protein
MRGMRSKEMPVFEQPLEINFVRVFLQEKNVLAHDESPDRVIDRSVIVVALIDCELEQMFGERCIGTRKATLAYSRPFGSRENDELRTRPPCFSATSRKSRDCSVTSDARILSDVCWRAASWSSCQMVILSCTLN